MKIQLEDFAGWCRHVASSYAKGDNSLRDDFYQEAMLTVWKTLQGLDSELSESKARTKIKCRVRDRMNNVWSRQDWTTTYKRSHSTVLDYVATKQNSPPDGEDPMEEQPIWASLQTTLDLDVLGHQNEILQAIAELPQKKREYVYLRFWLDYDTKMLAEHFGYKPFALWSGPWGAKKDLQAKLQHLKEFA